MKTYVVIFYFKSKGIESQQSIPYTTNNNGKVVSIVSSAKTHIAHQFNVSVGDIHIISCDEVN